MEKDIKKAIKYLQRDTVLKNIIKRFPKPEIKTHNKYFEALVRSIIYQQLSGKSASSIHQKFSKTLKGKITPKGVLSLTDKQFKDSGISPQKQRYLIDLSENFENKSINSKEIHKMSDEEVIKHLVNVKGIGRWTAEMFLMFTLGRLDVFPVGDLGIQKGFMYAYGMKKLPSEKKMLEVSKKWSPYKTIASMYLWKLADSRKQ